ncbi:MAG: GspE/PulE family protein [Gemmataceae bacterium]|nr:GspE/PulE family protein [Gemmataceae bacterium]
MAFDSLQADVDKLQPTKPDSIPAIVQHVLLDAVARGASDVHFEPTRKDLEIRYRLDGVMQTVARMPGDLAKNVVSRLKVMAELLTYRVDIPQEGRVADAKPYQNVDMRVSTFPVVHGEKVAVRLFDPTGQVYQLEQLGLGDEQMAVLSSLLKSRHGAVLMTGPSGSGKTTTIYACLHRMVSEEQGRRQIVSIEDPIERVLDGVSQTQVRPGTEFDFARGLRSLLRQDPEVIMIGEVRDAETAAIAIEAALTGHLVFTTLHSGSACGVISRLLDMGIEPYLLTSGLRAILNQRLIRQACPSCKRQKGDRVKAVGCPQCFGTGYRGRMLLAEILHITPELRQAILARADTHALEVAAQSCPRMNMVDAARLGVQRGLTTEEEIERVLGAR